MHEKQGTLTDAEKTNWMIGDQHIFIALDQETKLIPCYAPGKRDQETIDRFIRDRRRWVIVPENRNTSWDEKHSLFEAARNELGAARTLFKFKNNAEELLAKIAGESSTRFRSTAKVKIDCPIGLETFV